MRDRADTRAAILRGVLVAAALAGAIALPASMASGQPADVRFLSPGGISCADYPHLVMEIFGIADDLGIEVTQLDARTTIPLPAFLSSGQAEAVLMGASGVLRMADAGLPGRLVYETHQYSPLAIVVPADSPVDDLSALAGATIGLASEHDHVPAIVALDAAGIAPGAVSTLIVGDNAPVVAHAIASGAIDAVAGGAAIRARIEAEGIHLRNITPPEVSQAAIGAIAVWGPRLGELEATMPRFLKAWAMSQFAGIVDPEAVMTACRAGVREDWRDIAVGKALLASAIFTHQLRRTRLFGELQPDVWQAIQPAYVRLGEISAVRDPRDFIDERWIGPANDWSTREVKDYVKDWRRDNGGRMIR